MALATQANVEADLGRPLSDAEVERAASLLTKASAVVIGYARQDFEPAPYPEVVAVVTAGIVARVLLKGSTSSVFTESEQAGPFAVKYSSGSSAGDVWLTASDKLALRPYRRGGGLTSVRLVGDRYEITEP